MLTWEEYRSLATRTSNKELEGTRGLQYSALKISGEIGELFDLYGKELGQGHPYSLPKWREELGDILWHCVDVERHVGKISFPTEELGDPLSDSHMGFSEALKKLGGLVGDLILLGFSSHVAFDNIEKPFRHRVYLVICSLWAISRHLDIPPTEIAYDNITKLSHRYPDGFSAGRSVNRKETKNK